MATTSTFTEDDEYLSSVAERLTREGDLPGLSGPMPKWQELVDWVRRGGCPRSANAEAQRRLNALYCCTKLGQISDFSLEADLFGLVLYASVPIEMISADEEEQDTADVLEDMLREWGPVPNKPEIWRDWTADQVGDEFTCVFELRPQEVFADCQHQRDQMGRKELTFPLFPIIKDFLKRPQPVKPNLKAARIMPARIAMARDSDRRVPSKFSPAAYVQRANGRQLLMPGFEHDSGPSPALPLALYDLGGGSNDGKGEGAPLALRIFVESILAIPQEARNGHPAELEVSLREFLRWLAIDTPGALRRQSRYLDQLQRAIDALDKTWIPIYNQLTQEYRIERVVLVQGIPIGRGALEKPVRIYVTLPPGSENGPMIPPSLRSWGKQSAGAYRLLLNLCYLWFHPGRTRRPFKKPGRKVFWYQSQNPADYDPITNSELLRLAFPNSVAKNKTEMTRKALKALGGLESAGDVRTVVVGDKMIVMPPGNLQAQG